MNILKGLGVSAAALFLLMSAACSKDAGFEGKWEGTNPDNASQSMKVEFVSEDTVLMTMSGGRPTTARFIVAADGRAVITVSGMFGSRTFYARRDGSGLVLDSGNPKDDPIHLSRSP